MSDKLFNKFGDNLLDKFKEYVSVVQFDAIRIGIASPERIKALSYGEVKKIETINYRTLKPEKDGLFCAKIFGPQKDWECNCGKYKRMKHRGVTCEKCGVEVIQSRVRRERMGHIKLVAPVFHIWFLKGVPSYLSIILEITVKELEAVIYYDGFIVVAQGLSPYPLNTVLTPQEYDAYVNENPEDVEFKAEIGAQGIHDVLVRLDLVFESRKIEEELRNTSSITMKHKLSKRFKILKGLLEANIRPEWMVISILPVTPPELRPLVPLEAGRFASSDLNDLYRRVLNRNIRLRRLIDLDAPAIIVKNEKRMLQEAVDALIDNGRRGQFVRGPNKRPLKGLSEMLRGKQGRFRQNLLGKRVDYSARSVIVIEPELKLDQCGLPKIMALELFKPYVYVELQRRELASSLKVAKKMVSQLLPEVWEALEAVVQDRPIMLNRAPTLHRLGFQGFYPILVEGKAIKLHPLVCNAYNADFDGDQMAVHVPLSRKAQKEVVELMFSGKNLISPANGRPLMIPTKDMVLGLYFLTKKRCNVPGEGLIFGSVQELVFAYQHGKLHQQAGVKVRLYDEQVVETTVGRVLLYEALPFGSEIAWVNKAMKFRDLERMIYNIYKRFGSQATVHSLDKIKLMGFSNASYAGISLGITDVLVPKNKPEVVTRAYKDVALVEKLYEGGAITNGERYNKVLQVWAKATDEVADGMLAALEAADTKASLNEDGKQTKFNPIFIMLDSGSRGSRQQITQLGGMRGLMSNPSEEIMEVPVTANFREGLSVFEYFTSTHGARKGLADTALKTADAGYLTRRLVDVAQDVVIVSDDCGTLGYIEVCDVEISAKIKETMLERAFGRVVVERVCDQISGKCLLEEGQLIGDSEIELLKDAAVTKMRVRSPLTCTLKRGICAKCYGMDLSKGELVDIGLAVGIIAAQSIGEPGTQLTLRTFHTGGTASGLAEEHFKLAPQAGVIKYKDISLVHNPEVNANFVINRRGSLVIMLPSGREAVEFAVEYGSQVLVADGQEIKEGQKLFEWTPYKVILTDVAGEVEFIDLIENVTLVDQFEEDAGVARKVVTEGKDGRHHPCLAILDKAGNELAKYYLPVGAHLLVARGDKLSAGHVIATMPRERQRAKDITGGLPRVVELFEARNPKDPAILSDVSGTVRIGGVHKGARRVSVETSQNEIFEYSVPKNKHLNVGDAEKIEAGFALTYGTPNIHDILRIMGPDALQAHLVKGIQEVYMAQGVRIHDKHIEIIVRQMLKKVRIVDSGDTTFVMGEAVDRMHMQAVNDTMMNSNKRIAIGKPVLMGITRASLGTDSFIAAASFQETTRVLAEASVMGQVDYLRCLKSNVAIGRLISAGTGIASFRDKYIGQDQSDLEREAQREEELEAGLDGISLL